MFAWHGSNAPPTVGLIIANPTRTMQLRRCVLQQLQLQLQPILSTSSPSYRPRCLQCVAATRRYATQQSSRRSFATCNSNAAVEIQPRKRSVDSRPALSRSSSRNRTTYAVRRTYASIPAEELQFGQPVHETHPHLLRAGESRFLIASPVCKTCTDYFSASHTWNNRTRICRPTCKTCRKPPKQCHSNTCIFRHEVSFRGRIL